MSVSAGELIDSDLSVQCVGSELYLVCFDAACGLCRSSLFIFIFFKNGFLAFLIAAYSNFLEWFEEIIIACNLVCW